MEVRKVERTMQQIADLYEFPVYREMKTPNGEPVLVEVSAQRFTLTQLETMKKDIDAKIAAIKALEV